MTLRKFLEIFTNTALHLIFFSILFASFVWRITYYNFTIYDEVYYVESAKSLLQGGEDTNEEHPPLAKWFISLPMYLFGTTWSFGWRFAPLVAGFSGLIIFYYFSRFVNFPRSYALLLVLALIATKSWYILSRTAMLDIFVSFFVLIAGILLYIFLDKNGFSNRLKTYSKWPVYWSFCMVIGIAAATKWSGFFPLLFFVVPYWWFFVEADLKTKLRLIFSSLLLSLFVYSFVYLAILRFDFFDFVSRHGFSVMQHAAATLPKNNPIDHQARGGFDAFWRFFVFDQGYFLKVGDLDVAKLSNNQLLALIFLLFSLLILLVGVGKIIRVQQRLQFNYPEFIKDKTLWFCYLYAGSMILPWAIIPRNQYIYYFVPAFPFLILLLFRFLMLYSTVWVKWFVIALYFAYFLHGLYLVVPLPQ